MFRLFLHNGNLFYENNSYVEKNTFLDRDVVITPAYKYEDYKEKLPMPVWEGHDDDIACYEHVLKTAFNNFKSPNPESGFISPFIDTAFNGNLFMWDSAFNVMYGKYFSQVVDFQVTLDNFYARQHKDGFICRELSEEEAGDEGTQSCAGKGGSALWRRNLCAVLCAGLSDRSDRCDGAWNVACALCAGAACRLRGAVGAVPFRFAAS